MVIGDVEIYHRVEDIPDELPDAVYVVVDVLYFSSTVVELLNEGAEYVHVTETRGDELQLQAENPEFVIGGGTEPGYVPEEEYDYFNSPSFIWSIDVDGRPAAMTSTNGGRAINTLLEREGGKYPIYLATTTNAEAVGRHIRENEDSKPVKIVACGSKGIPASEDYIGAIHTAAAINNESVPAEKITSHKAVVRNAKGSYVGREGLRQTDADYVARFGFRSVIPTVDGRRIVRADE